ncbi:ABC transporter permease [Streptomyces turgidiscabies]|uniref:Amino acid or sugar ABC transporter, permease protein n=1 Tax=Streptomyces turgidiscabies (strain Car8) TaxID=698760 RepID=L7F5J6_STRT8|nr:MULTISPECIES: ABC transporter permease [Streptomyces]ELP66552.1 amino acid or sugar ABC transporter, permease protein [Streptomyces turgidiscabies Car8]MDX3494817.1 ABC transporter permease [Streptomyces turgidiscabies]GAQ71426.1 ribose transport system permease protein RbsC [Streptomyces turgidiscabies]
MPETVLAETPAPKAAAPGARRTALFGGRIPLARLRDLALVPAIVVIAIVGQIVSPVFLQTDNLINVLQTMSEIALLVLAQTMILIVKKMDLSLESTMGLAPGVAAWLTIGGAGHGIGLLPGAWAIPITLAVGALIGVVNSLLIIRFGLNGFIVTLGMLIVLRGILTGISGGQTFFQLPESMLYLGTTQWFGMPASIWLCLTLFAIAVVVLGWTSFGRSLYAIGGNVDAAKAAGIRTDRVLWIVLVTGSVLAALAGLLLSGRLASVASAQGNGYIFTVFAAAVIGGISLNGGKGTMFGAFSGILLLFMIQNVLTLGGVPAQWIGALNGLIILVALMISRITGGKVQD